MFNNSNTSSPNDQELSSPQLSIEEVTKKKRVGKACDSCRIKKTKCNGLNPCARCTDNNVLCTYTERQHSIRNDYPEGYVELLETRLNVLTNCLKKLFELADDGKDVSYLRVGETGELGINKLIASLLQAQPPQEQVLTEAPFRETRPPQGWVLGTEIASKFQEDDDYLKTASAKFAEHSKLVGQGPFGRGKRSKGKKRGRKPKSDRKRSSRGRSSQEEKIEEPQFTLKSQKRDTASRSGSEASKSEHSDFENTNTPYYPSLVPNFSFNETEDKNPKQKVYEPQELDPLELLQDDLFQIDYRSSHGSRHEEERQVVDAFLSENYQNNYQNHNRADSSTSSYNVFDLQAIDNILESGSFEDHNFGLNVPGNRSYNDTHTQAGSASPGLEKTFMHYYTNPYFS